MARGALPFGRAGNRDEGVFRMRAVLRTCLISGVAALLGAGALAATAGAASDLRSGVPGQIVHSSQGAKVKAARTAHARSLQQRLAASTGAKAAAKAFPGDFTGSYLCRGAGSEECLATGTGMPSVMHQQPYEYMLTYPGLAFLLQFNASGNLIEWDYTAEKVVWSAGTSGTGNRLMIESNGNVTVRSSLGLILWQTHTAGTGANRFGIAPNGDLGAFAASGMASGTEVWSNHFQRANRGNVVWKTSYDYDDSNPYEMFMQTDGNMVLYDFSGKRVVGVWSSGTAGKKGAVLVAQPGGPVFIYDKGKAIWAIWATSTTGVYFRGYDRHLQLANYSGQTLWTRPRP